LICRILTISLLIFVNLYGGQDKVVLSNEEVATKLMVEESLQRIYLHTPKFSKLVIEVREEKPEISKWIQQNIIDSCIAQNYSVYINFDDSIGSAFVVDISNPNITFEYHSLGSKWLFFNKGYKRVCKSNFHISIRENNGMVIMSHNFTNNFSDTLSNISEVEDEKIKFTIGIKFDSLIGKRIIEPVLITASTITMVYLFYSLRSGK
jgi:hypothetical protein